MAKRHPLVALALSAKATAENNRHKMMAWITIDDNQAVSECQNCGLKAQVTMNPVTNGGSMDGNVLSIVCPGVKVDDALQPLLVAPVTLVVRCNTHNVEHELQAELPLLVFSSIDEWLSRHMMAAKADKDMCRVLSIIDMGNRDTIATLRHVRMHANWHTWKVVGAGMGAVECGTISATRAFAATAAAYIYNHRFMRANGLFQEAES